MDNPLERRCSRCKTTKSTIEFHSGSHWCKPCSKRVYTPDQLARIATRQKAYRKANPALAKQIADRYYKKCVQGCSDDRKAEVNARRREIYQVDKERFLQYRMDQWSKINGGRLTVFDWNSVKTKFQFACLRCKRQEPEIQLSIDHVVPLSRGGVNSIENIQPLCMNCNSSKRTRTIDYRTENVPISDLPV